MAEPVTYVVQPGDYLIKIAKKFGTTVDAIMALNPQIKDKNLIIAGETIVISGTPYSEPKTVSNVASNVRVGLVADTERTLVARWDWSRHEDTDHYLARWWWGPKGQEGQEGKEEQCHWQYSTYDIPSNAERVTFYVKPVAKTDKSEDGKTETARFVADWSKAVTHYTNDVVKPGTPSAPSVEIKDFQLTATLDNLQDLNAESIEFHVYQDNGHLFAAETVKIVTFHASCTFTIEAGHDYKVQCRAWRGELCSDWSPYSGNQGTKPLAPESITTIRAASSTSVYLEWSPVDNAESYEIEYTTNVEYFDAGGDVSSAGSIKYPKYTKTGLESGEEYFFRVRAVNNQGESGWCEPKSIILGKKPAAPSTWSSTTTAVIGETLNLYWIHNSEDGSKQTGATLEFDVNGVITTTTIIEDDPNGDEDEEEKTHVYAFDTSGYTEGMKLKWRVKTMGITGEYGDWSIQRVVDVYAPPTLSLNLLDTSGSRIETLTNFPIRVTGVAGPSSQNILGFHLMVISNESYETIDHIGRTTTIIAGDEVYSKYFDISEHLDVTLSANDVDLQNNISYTVRCVVSMDSGLTGESSARLTVGWDEYLYVPNAEIGINKEDYSAIIRPYCVDENNDLLADVTLAVYRRMFDGSYVEIATGIDNNAYTYVIDPHPSLDYARYRIVATHVATGAVSYTDLGSVSVGGKSAIIQWNEEWSNFNASDGLITSDKKRAGSLLKLNYNIDVSDGTNKDVSLVKYIGREHPVSYYGTQLGETATWNAVIPKYDKDTLYALRRLSIWKGDVYVREPSGTGYWASISISPINVKHKDVTIPVTLNITRVEGGV